MSEGVPASKQFCWVRPFGFVFLVLLLSVPLAGAVQSETPLGFFTNVSARLLRTQLGADLHHIPVYPTNGYTPSLHRLLQVSANLYDSTTTNWYPTIFRPTFGTDGSNIFINGFEEVDATNESFLSEPLELGSPETGAVIATNGRVNIFGIPWIIGAKKGLPNFNEISLTSDFSVTRPVIVERPTMESPPSTFQFRQQLVMNLENEIGVEFWNSYRSNFNIPVEIVTECRLEWQLTNNVGGAWSNRMSMRRTLLVPQWQGMGSIFVSSNASFVVPLRSNVMVLPNVVFDRNSGAFKGTNVAPFEPVLSPPFQWQFEFQSKVRVLTREVSTGRILDYAQLHGPMITRYLDEDLRTSGDGVDGLWNTNLVVNPIIPEGVWHQIRISLGDLGIPVSDWGSFGINQPAGDSRNGAIARFRAFYFGQNMSYNGVSAPNPTNLIVQLPFTPTRRVLWKQQLFANDPLLHHIQSDMLDVDRSLLVYVVQPPSAAIDWYSNLGRLNSRYTPWGGNPLYGVLTSADVSLAIKDPGVRSSDDWDFPVGEPLSFSTIGRIHRGTPWQTIYLKSTDGVPIASPAFAKWREWTGNLSSDATNTIPIRDHTLVETLLPLLQTNDIHQLKSVNMPSAEWMEVLDGLTVYTNSSPEQALTLSSNSMQATTIVAAINENRQQQPGHYFSKVTDILSVPELSVESPFLWILPNGQWAPTDRALEALPAQLLSQVRPDSVGRTFIDGNLFRLQFSGMDGVQYRVESSPDLVNWSAMGTNTPQDGSFEFTLSFGEEDPHYFRSQLLR